MRDFKVIEHKQNGITHYLEDGLVQSVDPPESYFGFMYWSLMIPPFKPERILQLGCGKHTIIKLIEKVYGNGSVTLCSATKDIFKFIKECAEDGAVFDYVIVDFFKGKQIDKRILKDEGFIKDLDKVSTGLVAINTNKGTFKLERYEDYFKVLLVKEIGTNEVIFLQKKDDTNTYIP